MKELSTEKFQEMAKRSSGGRNLAAKIFTLLFGEDSKAHKGKICEFTIKELTGREYVSNSVVSKIRKNMVTQKLDIDRIRVGLSSVNSKTGTKQSMPTSIAVKY